MKRIYTFGGFPATRNLTVADIKAGKGQRKFVQTTAVNRVEAAAAEAVLLLHDDGPRLGAFAVVVGELVGIPADVGRAHVGIDAAQRACFIGHGEFVFHGVTGEGGVVGLDVEFEVL